MEHNKADKLPFQLDWNKLLPTRDDEPPPILIVKPSADSVSQTRNDSALGFDQPFPPADNLERLSDHKLRESLHRKKRTLETAGSRLPDKGDKLRAVIKRHEEELDRRKMTRLEKEVDESEKPMPATSSSTVGVSNGLRQENMSSQAQSQTSFASCFSKKMKDTDCGIINAFSKELSLFKHCYKHKMRDNGDFSQKQRMRDRSSSRKLPFQYPSNLFRRETLNNDRRCRAASTLSPQNTGQNLSGYSPELKDAPRAIQSDGSRSRKVKAQPIVLDDEDELHILEKTDEDDKLAEYLKEAKIYYPSSDDPESVEICYTDIDCLAPGGYLTSTIMNFYIRYLQQQATLTNRSIHDYHFFNTYFYKKLKEAVSYKQSDREAFFAKFRRWWKGVNIFQKAYILIPIHENLHWSLVIICIPDKEDESGPIILHLDSLGLHSSGLIFDNIRSYLREERSYLDRESVCSDIPIADRIWKDLDCKIEDRIITVPQQKNDYDCGLFVLYFIKRFIEEAPERLKKKDLAMFGKRWFKPEEASNLRVKIRNLLIELLQNSCKHKCTAESSPLSAAVTAKECVETIDDS